MNKKKLIVPLAVLLVAGAAWKLVIAKPDEVEAKVHGQVYVLPKEFVINLADGRFAKLGLGLVLSPDQVIGGHGAEAVKPPEGFGPLAQEALVRDIVTDTLTGGSADELVSHDGRRRLKKRILAAIEKRTDVHAEQVLFTDVAVQ